MLPGVFLGDAACFDRVAELTEASDWKFRVFTGYSVGGRSKWRERWPRGVDRPARQHQHLFETPVEGVWLHSLRRRSEPSMN